MTAQIKQAFDYLKEHESDMRPSQASFIASLRKYYRRNKLLTEKQTACLFDLKNDLIVTISDAAKEKL